MLDAVARRKRKLTEEAAWIEDDDLAVADVTSGVCKRLAHMTLTFWGTEAFRHFPKHSIAFCNHVLYYIANEELHHIKIAEQQGIRHMPYSGQ